MTRWIVIGAFMAAAACSSLSPQPPSTFDLNGQWVLQPELSESPPVVAPETSQRRNSTSRPRRAGEMQPSGGRQRQQSAGGMHTAPPADLFDVMHAEWMAIEQNADSMGIDYEPGNYRDVNWGKSERSGFEIEVGWKEDTLIITSKRDRMKVRESYTLTESGDRLIVEIEVGAHRRGFVITRVYDRIERALRGARGATPT